MLNVIDSLKRDDDRLRVKLTISSRQNVKAKASLAAFKEILISAVGPGSAENQAQNSIVGGTDLQRKLNLALASLLCQSRGPNIEETDPKT